MSDFTGTPILVRLILRQDRIQLPIWIVVLTLTQVVTVSSVVDLYASDAGRVALARSTAASPAALAFNGLVSGTSPGATIAAQGFVTVAVLVALMSTFGVVRHTRADEEAGRAELVGAGVVGRRAPLTAAVLVVLAADMVVGLAQVMVCMAYGLPVEGSVAFGVATAGVGATFAGIAAVAAQLPSSSRSANAMAAASVAIAFLLRGLGDATGTVQNGGLRTVSAWPSWFSPIGWGQQVRAYDDDAWWVLALPVVASILLVAGAFAIRRRRDLGAGVLPDRPGPGRAGASLGTPLGLAWRLQRTWLLGWWVGIVIVGLAYGAIGQELDEFLESSEQVADVIAQLGSSADLTQAYFATTVAVFGLVATGYALQAALRLRAEEARGHLEPLMSASVSRVRWLSSHALIAGVGALLLLASGGAATGLGYGLAVGNTGGHVSELLSAALVQAPAALVLTGFAVAAFGLFPRWATPMTWAALAACALLGQIGALLGLPDVVLNISPFSHLPAAPAEAVTAGPLIALTAVAAALLAVGALAFRRRDVTV